MMYQPFYRPTTQALDFVFPLEQKKRKQKSATKTDPVEQKGSGSKKKRKTKRKTVQQTGSGCKKVVIQKGEGKTSKSINMRKKRISKTSESDKLRQLYALRNFNHG